MGEVIGGDYNQWANNGMLDSVTNYECYKGIYSSHNEKNYFEIAHSLNREFGQGGIYKNLALYNFVDNHDVNRMGSTLKKKEYLYNVYTLLLTIPGVPSIYYGSEWGIEGIHKNDSDADLRPCLDLENIEGEYEGLASHIGKLCEIRRSLKALMYGDFNQVVTKNEQLIYKRVYNDETVYIALNLADQDSILDFYISNNKVLVDRLNNNEIIKANNNTIKLNLPAYSGCILEEIEE